MTIIERNNNKKGRRKATYIEHIDPQIWEFGKEFLIANYGTYYGRLGEFISECIAYTLENKYGVSLNSPNKPLRVRKNIPDPISSRRKNVIIKVALRLIEFDEEFEYLSKSIRNEIIKAFEEVNGVPPSRWTVKEYFDYLLDRGAIFKVYGSNGYKIRHKKLKEIIKNLRGEYDEKRKEKTR